MAYPEIILVSLGLSVHIYMLTLPLFQVYSTTNVCSIFEPTESRSIAACIEATCFYVHYCIIPGFLCNSSVPATRLASDVSLLFQMFLRRLGYRDLVSAVGRRHSQLLTCRPNVLVAHVFTKTFYGLSQTFLTP